MFQIEIMKKKRADKSESINKEKRAILDKRTNMRDRANASEISMRKKRYIKIFKN
jgi:hypothetical protein